MLTGAEVLLQAWLWCIVGTLVWVVWMRFLKRMQDTAAAHHNVKNVTAADFSAWISNLPKEADSDDELRKFAEHYGEVVAAFHIRRMGNVLNLNNKIEDEEKHLDEIQALSSSPVASFWDSLYRRYVCGLSSPDDAVKKLQVLLTCCLGRYAAISRQNVLR
jgi:hypothetical protein